MRTAIAYAGEGAVRLAQGGVLMASARVDGREAALAALAAGWKDVPAGTRLRVAVSGAVCRPYLLPEVEGVTGEADWAAIAASLVEESTGLPSDSPVWLDAGQASPRLAVAIDAAWLRGLESLAGRRLESVRPWWAMAIDAARAASASATASPSPAAGAAGGRHGLAVADSEALVLLLAEGDTYRVAQTYTLDGEPADAVLNRALVTHDWPAESVSLVEFEGGALPGQGVAEALPFSKEASA
ncbi:hypothetical protein [Mitsuaria sp. GD03876]|uniref:hypothetical protein n=1 Tax=Mitsuaria sp. GD03876 TaxID=2975399 RepID=UPI00244A809B|nr:hypothetical protein [Mitsuaria sp. GD03876]MDH0867072.1 hypothetical protein [Mitsuaria sp. GD03876]